VDINDPAFLIGLAFVLGFLVRQVGLPPLIGFLGAGFLLRGVWGIEFNEGIGHIADLGVTLMLFSIGLKLRPKDLTELPVWLGATAHLLIVVCCFTPLLMAGGALGLPLMTDLDWINATVVAFALAFSSTVFAVVVFQAKGETNADFAKVTIGILIMQDLFAVVFMAASKGQIPSLWALPVVIGLTMLRRPLGSMLNRAGHGELLILSALLMPIGVYKLFEAVGLKGDLGAIYLGVLLANSKKAEELSKLLFNFKELLLVTFFVSVGLRGDPTVDVLIVAGLLLLVMPFKTGLFYLLLTRLGLGARNATFTTMGLSNYSEFGLIVGALAASKGWIADEWLLVFAVALAVSYALASPVNMGAEPIFERFRNFLHRFERASSVEPPVDLQGSRVLIIGMGRMGRSTYRQVDQARPGEVMGMDFDRDNVERLSADGYRCFDADGTDLEFWQRVDRTQLEVVLITMPNQVADLETVTALRGAGYDGFLAVTTAHDDESAAVIEAGADTTYSIYGGAAENVGSLVCGQLTTPEMKPESGQAPAPA
jgi:predicted Kef-type K+ transport protein